MRQQLGARHSNGCEELARRGNPNSDADRRDRAMAMMPRDEAVQRNRSIDVQSVART
jgi:hypothetical protein